MSVYITGTNAALCRVIEAGESFELTGAYFFTNSSGFCGTAMNGRLR